MPTIRASDNSWRGKIRRYKTARGLCAQYRRLLGEAVLNLNLEQVFVMNSEKTNQIIIIPSSKASTITLTVMLDHFGSLPFKVSN